MDTTHGQSGFVIEGLLLLFALVFIAFVAYHALKAHRVTPSVHDYNSCAAAGYPVLLTYPQTCHAPGGQSYTQPN